MSTHTTTTAALAVISPQPQQQQLQQLHSETTNGQSFRSYPTPTALYQDVLQSSQLFWEKLGAFHRSFATKFTVPTVGGKSLDLYQLFVEVTSRGGLEKVIRDRRWKEVIAAFNFPSTITSASFVLRKYYLSLLYHFEQVYLFQKEVPSFSTPDTLDENLVIGSTTPDEGVSMNPIPGIQQLQLGSSVAGTIDGKFDSGYLVTVDLGSDQLKGVLYHIPNAFDIMSQNAHPSRRQRKRSRLLLNDPSRPKSNRSGYNFFFAEHYARLKPLHNGEEKAIGKKIGVLWNNLTEAEKQIYEEKGMQEKERYRSEMLEYRSCGQ
ncbi:high mobility group B protein 10 [Euphorbia lathyris]|uniref:high mobility group B protein 10 n=1 Tax=Euphorbia lathyris TaxID=212925 RepID=UPI003313B06A